MHASMLTAESTNLCSDDTYRYAVWYTDAGEVVVGRQTIAAGIHSTWTTHQMAGAERSALALPITDDPGHTYPAIAVDGQGYLHLWANMHTDPQYYVKSNSPQTITAWTAATVPFTVTTGYDKGTGFDGTYPWPIKLPDGGLFLILRDQGASARANTNYWKLPANSSTWSQPTLLFQGLGVPNGGGAGVTGDTYNSGDTNKNWSCYPSYPHLEDRGGGAYRLHMAWVWRVWAANDASAQADGYFNAAHSNIKLSYGYYDSATDHWFDVTGTQVTLPIDPINTTQVQTGIVGDNSGGGYVNGIGITLTPVGRPKFLVISSQWSEVDWDGAAWQRAYHPAVWILGGVRVRGQVVTPLYLDGNLWYLSAADPDQDNLRKNLHLWKADGTEHRQTSAVGIDVNWTPNFDHKRFRETGALEMLADDRGLIAQTGIGVRMRAA